MANKGKIAGFVKNKNKTIFNTQLDSWIYPKVLILIFQKMGKFRSTSTLHMSGNVNTKIHKESGIV